MKVKTFFGVLLMTICAYRCQSSSLVVDVVEILSTDSFTFVCNVPPSTNLTRWTYLSGPTGTSLMSYQNGLCTVSPSDSFLSDRRRYSYACNSTVHQVTLHSDGVGLIHNRILSCKDAYKLTSIGFTWIIKSETADGSCSYCQPTISFDIVEVSEGDNAQFACSVSSNVSYVNWNRNIGANTAAIAVRNGKCITSSNLTYLNNESKYTYSCSHTVYQVTLLDITRSEHNDIYMCTPSGQTDGTGSNWILTVVKAPVTSVKIITPPDYLVNTKEITLLEFTCTTSTARPTASVYWYRHSRENDNIEFQITDNITLTTDYYDLSVTTSILRLFVTRQDNDTKIFCRANNAANTTKLVSKNKRLLNVLYTSDDPYIVEGREYRAIEYTNGNLSCSVKGGNPTPTLSWSCNNFSPTHQSTINSNGNVTSTLTWNVSRNHDGRCTCKSHQTGFTDMSVDEATIKLFSIKDFDFTKVNVDENGKVTFICTADSNPEAVMTLRHERNILETVTSNIVEYNIDKARCSDAGTYYCSATNKYIGEKVSTQNVKLFVNCAPRAAGELNTNITSAKNESKTITVNVIAFPSPTFLWSQLMDLTWTSLDNNNKFVISSLAVQSNLTIRTVDMDDFTKYRVIVKNKVGQMEQNFTLSPYSIPDTPTELIQIQSHTTTSSIQIGWRPGYNGGPNQTFYIKFKKNSDTAWTYFSVIDSGEEIMDISLNGLVENTLYDIVIFASNIIGNSSESPVLLASTKDFDPAIWDVTIICTRFSGRDSTQTNLGPLIGGIAGGVTACLVIVIIIIVILRRFTLFKECWEKRSRKKSDGTNDSAEEHAYYNTGSVTDRDNNSTEDATSNKLYILVPNYETVNLNNVESPQYSTLDQTEQCTTDDTSSGDNKAVYENMKIKVFKI